MILARDFQLGFWNEIFDNNFSIIISIQLQENKKVFIKYTLFLIHNIFFVNQLYQIFSHQTDPTVRI